MTITPLDFQDAIVRAFQKGQESVFEELSLRERRISELKKQLDEQQVLISEMTNERENLKLKFDPSAVPTASQTPHPPHQA